MTKTSKKSFIIDTRDAINESTLQVYKEEIIEFAENLGLAVAKFPFTLAPVEEAEVGEFISVGTSPEFDLSLIVRRGYVTEKGFKPILNIVKDFNEIKKRLLDYALGTNFTNETLCGDKITFHHGFVKIDNEEGSTILKNEELLGIAARSIQLNLFH